ncbi:hypothetical protein SAMN04515647_4643 [Cohaesibacter sp. ES.047]|uniref:hypothetical protein n=1 Tax=Cohaesibacter sp. ES.047 TaxID=1798205 RepID=UPI000BB7A337|nr:hypothetical protein [Cohaesibacter sp. ES.047]SNY94322.1 hypothetical protein SAMN04515647_4643 [Cohaesibacter sp. ES.047]
MSFSFLHSANSNIALFSKALEGAGVEPQQHVVRNDLLLEVTAKGQIDAPLSEAISAAITTTAKDVDLVLLTCSSLSPVADTLKADGVPVERTDGLLARAVLGDALAKGEGSKLVILVAAPTTTGLTRSLFERCRAEMGADRVPLEVELLPNVWDIFLSGDVEGYKSALTKALDRFLATSDASHIALGQASMGPALDGCSDPKAAAVWTVAGATRDFLTASDQAL